MHLSKIILGISIATVAYQARFSLAQSPGRSGEGLSFQDQMQKDYPNSNLLLQEKFMSLAKSKQTAQQKFEEVRSLLHLQMKEAAKAKQKSEQGYLAYVEIYFVMMVGEKQTCTDENLRQALRDDRQVNNETTNKTYKGSFEYAVAVKLRNLVCPPSQTSK